MSSSPPEGFTVRPATEDDIAAVAAVLNAAETAVRGRSNVTAADAAEWFRLIDLDATWLVHADGELAALGAAFHRAEPPNIWASVHPKHVGCGLGSYLLERGESYARNKGSSAIRAGRIAGDERAAELFRIRGYREVRRHYTMAIELRERPSPPHVPGVRIEPFRAEDARVFYDAQLEAFADEWGFVALTFDEWKRLRLEATGADTGAWFLAREADEAVGTIRCDTRHLGGGFVGAVGVRAPWRRRGIGEALLVSAFRAFYDRGERWVRLGVDTQNPTGATRLYERVGMHVESEEIAYEKALT